MGLDDRRRAQGEEGCGQKTRPGPVKGSCCEEYDEDPQGPGHGPEHLPDEVDLPHLPGMGEIEVSVGG